MINKILRDGSTAKIEAWDDKATDQVLYRVHVKQKKGTSIALPLDVREGTWEKVEQIFDGIDEQNTFNDIFENELRG